MIVSARWERVRALFHQALERPPDDWGPFVRGQSDGDEDVFREVASLLAAHGEAGTFLSVSPIDALSTGERRTPTPSLQTGGRIGAFEILGLLGSGGMGEVYRALDTRLDRAVAIKVLSPDLASDPRGGERFEREARLLSKVTHPHICTLYDVGSVPIGGREQQFLVMELLEGETLAARLRRGPLPVAQALIAGAEIVDALAAAHALGIVHRDLKPANIVLTKSGVKLLDFGLARLRAPSPGPRPAPAATDEPLTAEGSFVGTLPYMAPEQVRGEGADARSDLFAFGAVLYEMITGARAFAGDSQAALAAAILEREPPSLTTRQPLAPPALEHLITACLAKDPGERWQTAHDLFRELMWIRNGDAAVRTMRRIGRRGAVHGALGWMAALAAATLLATVVIYLSRHPAPTPLPLISFSIYPPEGTRFPRGTAEMAISPDGSRLVFVALSSDGINRLWIRRFDSVVSRAIDGSEDADYPFWSADGRSIAFFARGKLKKVAEAGGSPQVLCDVRLGGQGGTWNRNGTILFSAHGQPLFRVADTGGAPTAVTALDESRQEVTHAWPVFLPDGRRFLYLARSNDRELTGVYQGSLDSPDKQRVLAAESNVGLGRTTLFSLNKGSLIAQAYDADRGWVGDELVPVAEHIALDSPLRSGAPFSVTSNGVIAYRSASPDSRLLWFDRSGRQIGSVPTAADYQHPWLSPSERQVAVEKTDAATGRHTIWVLDLLRGITSRLVSDGTGAHQPVWAPDGSRVMFSSNRLGGIDLYSARADGTGPDELVLSSSEKVSLVATDWSLDGRLLLYQTVRTAHQNDLGILPVSSPHGAKAFIETAADERQGQFSPDVRWIAYTSDESGVHEVYVRRFPEGDGKWQVSTQGGAQPRWRRDGKELFYLAPDGRLMAAEVKIGGRTFETGAPRALFSTGITGSFIDRRNQYLVTRDGQRFLVNISVEDENSAPITVVLNWEATLKK